jgi:hypothetical protein
LDGEMVKWSSRAVAGGLAEQLDAAVLQMTRQAIQQLRANISAPAAIATPTRDATGAVDSLRAARRAVSAKVAFMAELLDLPAERLAAALHSRGLPLPPCASRESLVDGLVGGASATEMRPTAIEPMSIRSDDTNFP